MQHAGAQGNRYAAIRVRSPTASSLTSSASETLFAAFSCTCAQLHLCRLIVIRRQQQPGSAGILRVDIHVPHAANTLGEFEPLPAVNYTGQYAITVPLSAENTERLLVDVIDGPEHLVYRSAAVSSGEPQTTENEGQLPGDLWISSANGTIYKVAVSADATLKTDTLEEVIFAGPGRVLGFAFDRAGGLYLCNSLQVWMAAAYTMPAPPD